MKHLMIVTSVAAMVAGLAPASAQDVKVPPVAAQRDNSRAPNPSSPAVMTPHTPETTGRTPREAAGIGSSEEEAKAAAEARRVRAAVGRTLERTRELSRSELYRSELSQSDLD